MEKQFTYSSPKLFDSARDFLNDVLESNHKRNANLSARWFSQRLEWPGSLIYDVLSFRKKMSLQRALEFAKFLDLDSIETEQLVLLILSEDAGKMTQKYFQRKIETERAKLEVSSIGDEHPFTEMINVILYTFIGWKAKPCRVEEMIVELAYVEELNESNIQFFLEALSKYKLIEKNDEGLWSQIPKDFMSSHKNTKDELKMKINQNIFSNLNKYLSCKPQTKDYIFGFSVIPLDESVIEEVRSRVTDLFNWVYEKRNDFRSQDSSNIYQLQISAIPLVIPVREDRPLE